MQARNYDELNPLTLQEWQGSGVDDQITRLNVEDLDHESAFHAVCEEPFNNLGAHAKQYVTKERKRLEDRAAFLESGGWWVSGLDPLNQWQRMSWGQFKPKTPRLDPEKGKPIKYETPWQTKARAIFLKNSTQNYWQTVQKSPKTPIVITEGAKKAGCLMTAGYAAIALPGITMGYRLTDDGDRVLIPELAAMACPGREVIICFDQDLKPKTREKIKQATRNLATLLREEGCTVKITNWDGREGKGIDDLGQGLPPVDRIRQIKEIIGSAQNWQPPKQTAGELVFEHFYTKGRWITVDDTLYQWQGTHYQERNDDVEIPRISKYLRQIISTQKDGTEYKPYAAPHHTKTALEWVKQLTSVSTDRINPTGALNLLNGVLVLDWSGDVPTWKLELHNPDKYLFTHPPLYNFDPQADPAHCNTLLSALQDNERDIFLRTIAAAIDLPEVRKRKGRLVKALMLWGYGANGKDTLRDATRGLFGDKGATSCTLSDFKEYDRGRKFGLSSLEHSRVNWASENVRVGLDKVESLKATITGDPIWKEPKGKDAYEIMPHCILMFNVNDMPNIKAAGEAIKSRFAILTLEKTFTTNADPSRGEIEADPRFKYDPQWMRGNVLPALLNQVLNALQDLIRDGIDYTPTNETLERVRRDNSHLLEFVHDAGFEYAPDAQIPVSELWEHLELWYQDQGILTTSDGKKTWGEMPNPLDKPVKAAHWVARRFAELFPRISIAQRLDYTPNGSKTRVPVVMGLGLIKQQDSPEVTPKVTPKNPEVTPKNENSDLGVTHQNPCQDNILETDLPRVSPVTPNFPVKMDLQKSPVTVSDPNTPPIYPIWVDPNEELEEW